MCEMHEPIDVHLAVKKVTWKQYKELICKFNFKPETIYCTRG